MESRDESFEKEDQLQDSALEITELDDQELDDVSGGIDSLERSVPTNENCSVC